MVQRPEKSQEKSQDEHNRNNEFQQYNGWDVKNRFVESQYKNKLEHR